MKKLAIICTLAAVMVMVLALPAMAAPKTIDFDTDLKCDGTPLGSDLETGFTIEVGGTAGVMHVLTGQ